MFHEEMRNLRYPGGNCTFRIKIRSTHCYWLTWCSLVFLFLSGHNHRVQRFCKLVTPRCRSRTPDCVSLGWGCVPIGIELFANMIYVGRTTIPENSHRSQPAAVRQVKLSSDFWGSSLYAFHFAESPTSVLVFANQKKSQENFCFTKKGEKWK